jgi:predicted acetyltransferase
MTEEDREQVIAVRQASFNTPREVVERFRGMPVDGQRVGEENGRIIAATASNDFSFFFGRRAVATAGIAGVVVAPEARGRHLAEEIVGRVLAEERASMPLSSLYPATVPIYRRLGYEFGALRTRYKVPIVALPRFADAGTVEPWGDDAVAEVSAAQNAFASEHNGTMNRTEHWWTSRVLGAWGGETVYRYLVRENGAVTGSIVYTQEGSWHYAVECRDVFWTTQHALRTILTFLAGHASLGTTVEWFGPPVDPAMLLIAQDALRKDFTDVIQYPMYRILDLAGAIEARGYDPDVSSTVTIAVDDPLFPQNAGAWRLHVEGGKGAAEPAADGEMTLDMRTLAAIYTGFLAPAEALRAGLASGSADAGVRLARVFYGSAPWATDFF